MLRSLPKEFNLIHYIMREQSLDLKKGFRGRELRVIYRYSLPNRWPVTGHIVGTDVQSGLVQFELDNGKMLWRKPESFDLVDLTGKLTDYIVEFYK